MGEFFETHPGPHLLACCDLVSELHAHRCRLRGQSRGPAPGRHLFVALAEPAYGAPCMPDSYRPPSYTTARIVPAPPVSGRIATPLRSASSLHYILEHLSSPASLPRMAFAEGSAMCPGTLSLLGAGYSALLALP